MWAAGVDLHSTCLSSSMDQFLAIKLLLVKPYTAVDCEFWDGRDNRDYAGSAALLSAEMIAKMHRMPIQQEELQSRQWLLIVLIKVASLVPFTQSRWGCSFYMGTLEQYHTPWVQSTKKGERNSKRKIMGMFDVLDWDQGWSWGERGLWLRLGWTQAHCAKERAASTVPSFFFFHILQHAARTSPAIFPARPQTSGTQPIPAHQWLRNRIPPPPPPPASRLVNPTNVSQASLRFHTY